MNILKLDTVLSTTVDTGDNIILGFLKKILINKLDVFVHIGYLVK